MTEHMEKMPIGEALRRVAEEDPERPSLTHEGRTITRRELDLRSNRLARAYSELGVGEGDVAVIALPNGIEFYEAACALWKLGATPLPISARLPRTEREAILELAQPVLVIGLDPKEHAPGSCLPRGFEPDPSLPEDPLPPKMSGAWVGSTSGGSTGRPKVIMSGAKGHNQPRFAAAFGIRRDGVQLVPGPLYHGAPFVYSAIGLFHGNHIIVMSRFDPVEVLRLVETYRVEWMWVVPTMMSRIMRLDPDERNGYDVSSLRRVWHGAAPCPISVKKAWIEWLGAEKIFELYSGTEAVAFTVVSGEEWLEHPGSVGRPIFGEVQVFDADGRPLPPGEIGEVYLRMPGSPPTYQYVGAEERRRDDGWDTLGDMGWLDEDGYLYIADRRTDMIVTGGANVYPAEVEKALDEHPLVHSCAVIGLPDEDMGQIVHAIVETDRDIEDAELSRFLSERIAPYKIPRSYEYVTEPLRDEAGKVRRSQLRQERIGRMGAELSEGI